jgi:general secretion pathway protein M
VLGRRAALAATAAMLDQLQGRKGAAASRQGADVSAPSGSPFLEGATVTVAGAALLERVTSAIARLGGNVQSSQIDLQGNQAQSGFITMIASCDIDQPNLQRLLYDIEAGMPFLFVDQLVVQTPLNNAPGGEGRLRILLSVSGQWQEAK